MIIKKWNQYRSRKRWWSILLDFLFLVLVIAMLIPASRKSVSAFVVRHTLLSPRESTKTIILDNDDWQFTVEAYNGTKVKLSELDDKPIFINYWATWCPPCIAEMPAIQNLYDKYKDDVHFIFISNEAQHTVEAFMTRRDFDLPLYKVSGLVPDAFESTVLPTTIVVSKGGRVVLYKTGAAKWDSKRVFKLMDKLINESSINSTVSQ